MISILMMIYARKSTKILFFRAFRRENLLKNGYLSKNEEILGDNFHFVAKALKIEDFSKIRAFIVFLDCRLLY